MILGLNTRDGFVLFTIAKFSINIIAANVVRVYLVLVFEILQLANNCC